MSRRVSQRFSPCAEKVNNFCYICGNYIFKKRVRSITPSLTKLYQEYFKIPLGDQDKDWAPHVVCSSCAQTLNNWKTNNGKTHFAFAVPMYWMEITSHDDCYFCLTKTECFNKNTVKNIK